MQFSNRPNHPIDIDGKEHWISRSVAISVVLFFLHLNSQKWYIPLVKRGPGLPSEVGKLCLPCGYLDRDETAADAMRREVWEEIGLDLGELMWHHARVGNMQQPFHVDSSPNSYRQNVTLEYFLAFALEELPPLSLNNTDPEELTEAVWMPIEKACKIDLAFAHELIIRERWERIQRQQDLFK